MSDLGGEEISSIQSMVLDLPPSCIEFCPAHPSYFVVGTYNLEKSEQGGQQQDGDEDNEEGGEEGRAQAKAAQPQNRNGSIVVFRLRDGKVYPIQTIPQPSAVFDLHFSPHPGQSDVCAAVSSTGTISFFRLVPDTIPKVSDHAASASALEYISDLRIPDSDSDVLFTYFSWHPINAGLMAITTASGKVILVQVHDDYRSLAVVEESVLEHSLEAWVVAFSPPPHPKEQQQQSSPLCTIFSGGDDSALRFTSYDPSPSPSPDEPTPSHTPYPPLTIRGHNAGVTSILPLPIDTSSGSHLVLTGSYDDALRLYAIAPQHVTYGARKSTLLAEHNLGGGVWRLNIIGGISGSAANGEAWEVTVLASCMHAGARIVRIRGRGGEEGARDVEMDVLARFEEHKSMNYGSDWSRVESHLAKGGVGEVVCVSTSFYDRLLCIWRFKQQQV